MRNTPLVDASFLISENMYLGTGSGQNEIRTMHQNEEVLQKGQELIFVEKGRTKGLKRI